MNADEHGLNELSRNFKIATKARRHEEKNLVTWWLHGRKKLPNA